MTDRVIATAEKIVAAFESKEPILALPDGEGALSREDAFAIQDAAFELMGRKVGAWKVGGAPGTEPTASPIATSKLYHSGQTLPSRDHRNFGVEAEIAFRLGTDLPARAEAYAPEEIRDALSAMIVAIEVVESRLKDWPEVDPLWALMDFQANESLVLGTELPVPATLGFETQPVRLLFNGEVAFEDTGTFGGGDPYRLIGWLANHAPTRTGLLAGRGLKAGDVITTGSWNGVSFAAPGTTARIEFPGLGDAEMRFD